MRVAALVIPPGPGHVRTARLLAASVARQSGLTAEVVEDVRLAVSEACLLHLGLAQPIHIDFDAEDDALAIAVGPSALPAASEPDSQLAMTLLRAIVPQLELGDSGLRMVWPTAGT